MKNALSRAKNFVVAHQTKIFIATTVLATSAAVVMKAGLDQHNDFLRSHNLYEKFYDLSKDILNS